MRFGQRMSNAISCENENADKSDDERAAEMTTDDFHEIFLCCAHEKLNKKFMLELNWTKKIWFFCFCLLLELLISVFFLTTEKTERKKSFEIFLNYKIFLLSKRFFFAELQCGMKHEELKRNFSFSPFAVFCCGIFSRFSQILCRWSQEERWQKQRKTQKKGFAKYRDHKTSTMFMRKF